MATDQYIYEILANLLICLLLGGCYFPGKEWSASKPTRLLLPLTRSTEKSSRLIWKWWFPLQFFWVRLNISWKNRIFKKISNDEIYLCSCRLKRWPTTSELNWNLNERSLSEAIANFGHVDMDGVLMLSRGEQSKCLPARSVFENKNRFASIRKFKHKLSATPSNWKKSVEFH